MYSTLLVESRQRTPVRCPRPTSLARGLLCVAAGIVLCSSSAAAQATTVFRGRPATKVSEAGTGRVVEVLDNEKAQNLECIISKIGEEYYWASRENRRMVRVDEGGAFITFIAVRGEGYVKIIKPGWKEAVALLGETGQQFDYVEHLPVMLGSVTYWGVERR